MQILWYQLPVVAAGYGPYESVDQEDKIVMEKEFSLAFYWLKTRGEGW